MTAALTFDGALERGSFVLQAAFTCSPGEVIGVLGPNGSGKSTLVSTLAGLNRLSGGTIRLGDVVWDDGVHFTPPARRRVGFMSADGDLFPHLTALDNVMFGLRATGVSRRNAQARAEEELEALHIYDLANRRPRELSSGQAQRVALARALVGDPDLLLLDEPLSAVDQSGRDELRAILSQRLHETRALTLLITHDPIEALTLTDRLLFLEKGQVTQFAPPAEVVRQPRTEFAARVAGLNLVRGKSEGNTIRTPAGAAVASTDVVPSGRHAFAAFSPSAVSLWPQAPEGSPRNSWPCTVVKVEHLGPFGRVHLSGGLNIVADVTPEAITSLRIQQGLRLTATVKATDVRLYP